MSTNHSTTPLARTAGRVAAAGLVTATVLLGLAGTASAHVSVNPDTAVPGSFSQLSFRVPNEEDGATTTKVEVVFPDDQPLAFVAVQPVPGWKVTIGKTTLPEPIKSDDGDVTRVVSKITWSGGNIGAGEYQNFDVSVGSLPAKPTTMTFKALQTYSNGDVVRWIDVATGDAEPEHPAPVLTIKAAGTGTAATTGTTTHATTTEASNGSDGLARGLGAAGLLAGLAGVGLGLAARRRRTKPAPAGDATSKQHSGTAV